MAAGSDPSSYSGGTLEADHLCVLVHGLWGNPIHMVSVAKALRAQHPPNRVYILLAKSNSGSFTYDGIELGGERVCHEIEEELDKIRARGGNIKKLSIVGYSLGGLVARYAIGLLFARGVLDNLECLNFTAFASPFLGVRTPLRGWHNHLWNVLGARTLCTSGRQLFGIDNFRGTGKPLLAVLADPNSVFMSGLAKFKRHTLYTNIVNDRSAVFYTTGISKTDPFADLSKVKVRYLKGYEDVILDPDDPVSPLIDGRVTTPFTATAVPSDDQVTKSSTAAVGKEAAAVVVFAAALRHWARRAPMALVLAVLVPLGTVAFLLNSAVQTARSARRVRLHERGLGGVPTDAFRGIDLFIREVRGAVEDAYVDAAAAAAAEAEDEADEDENGELIVKPSTTTTTTTSIVPVTDADTDNEPGVDRTGDDSATDVSRDGGSRSQDEEQQEGEEEEEDSGNESAAFETDPLLPTKDVAGSENGSESNNGPFPTLALAPYQFAAIEALNQLGWRKYPVWIHKHSHSHAAMIVRMEKPGFEEGRLVLKHWVTEEFLV
ncbi:hypothetical protein VTH82DRAFT_1909 [Thermothelomyces myriococcoides]